MKPSPPTSRTNHSEGPRTTCTLVTDTLVIPTRGDTEIVNLTGRIQELVKRHHFRHGQALVFVPGSTAGVTTIEHEPGLLQDLPEVIERLVPRTHPYHHDDTWHDGNGHSHIRATLLGPSITVPFKDGTLMLGMWQQVVLIDFDTRPRQREIIIQLSGELAD
jgi:secondary thiamine-phosphate synthase enzyme